MNSVQIFELIVNNLKEIVPGLENTRVEPSDMLSPLGASSIERAELIEKTLEDLNLDASRFEFHSAHNLGQLADMFALKLQTKLELTCKETSW